MKKATFNSRMIDVEEKGKTSLEDIIHKVRKIDAVNNKYKIPMHKKIIFSLISTAALFGSLYLANSFYVYRQRELVKGISECVNEPSVSNDAGCGMFNISHTQLGFVFGHPAPGSCKDDVPCLIKNYNYGAMRINSLGFKGEEFTQEKQEGVFRIVCLGASTTFGIMDPIHSADYPKTLQVLLDAYARASHKTTRFEVINAGISAATSRQMVKRFKRDVIPLRPDLVIYGPEWNDVSSCSILSGNENLTLKRYYIGLESDEDVMALGPWFERHIDVFRAKKEERTKRLYSAFQDLEGRARQKLPILNLAKSMFGSVYGRLGGSAGAEEDKLRIEQSSHMDDFDPWFFRQSMEELMYHTKENGVRLGIATTPDDFEDYTNPGIPPNCYVIYEASDWISYNRRVLNPEIRRIANDNDLILVDLEREMGSLPSKKPFFASEFVHYTPEGHDLLPKYILSSFYLM